MLECMDFLCRTVPPPVDQHLFVSSRSASIRIQTLLVNSCLLNIFINKGEQYWQNNLFGQWWFKVKCMTTVFETGTAVLNSLCTYLC